MVLQLWLLWLLVLASGRGVVGPPTAAKHLGLGGGKHGGVGGTRGVQGVARHSLCVCICVCMCVCVYELLQLMIGAKSSGMCQYVMVR